MSQIYISLDLETTGFEPAFDQVIEIAAIKFQNNQIIDRFETLINPEIEIPSMVSHITGINTELVKNAPTFSEIKQKLSEFLGNYPIIGHNIEFDLNFLEAKGIPILNKQIDTLKLSNILLNNLPSLSLETISTHLNIKHEHKHRAMSDASVCVDLFNILKEKITEIPKNTLDEIKTLIKKSNWDLADIFQNAESQNQNISNPVTVIPKPENSTLNISINSIEDLINLLNQNSPFTENIHNYEVRAGQIKMINHILNSFQNNTNAIIEAGTGTGKTLAYLLAAAFAKTKWNKKVIISTHTNNLQDQITNKDFNIVKTLFPNIQITTLKGRKKYFSISRFNQFKNKDYFEEYELTAIIKILLWLNHTGTGDLDELNLINKEITLYEVICSDPDHQPLKDQEFEYLEKARQKAESADIVVVNHALLIQDTISDNIILPNNPILIVDEAHHLETTITDAQTVSIGSNKLEKILNNIISPIEDHKNSTMDFSNIISPLLSDWKKIKPELSILIEKVFLILKGLLEQKVSINTNNQNLTINQQILQSTSWIEVLNLLHTFIVNLPQINNLINKTNELITDLNLNNTELNHNLFELNKYFSDLQKYTQNTHNLITWINKGMDESIHFKFTPLKIQETVTNNILPRYSSIILTSATLTTNNNFQYIKDELGLDPSFEELQISSHFSYPDQVKIIIPEDLTEPKNPEYLEQCEKIIEQVIKTNGGRTLVLFTAKRDLHKIYFDLAPQLKQEGFELLGQNISGGRGKIISHFSHEPAKTAILGTNSFWEGVDLAGNILTSVIIQKLPFDPPDDPIISSRSTLFSQPFDQYSLPRAILRFKQGFGRLIRSASDTGAVIILDSRLVQKSYGQSFISSLPAGIQIHQCKKDQVHHFLSK